MIKTCERCGKEFNTSKRTQKFCCWECKIKAQVLDNEVVCPVCWEEFKPRKRHKKFCSVKCYGISRRKDKTQICPTCWISFQKKYCKQIYCSNSCANKPKVHFMREHNAPWKNSKPNKNFLKLLNQLWFEVEHSEFCLDEYYFDFKIWNILLELNPYPYHNSTRAPKASKPKDKMYHYNKKECAIRNWYRCIMVRDWTTNLTSMITKEWFHYEGPPQLHYYNPKTKEHLLDDWFDKEEMINKWFVEIRDCWKETF